MKAMGRAARANLRLWWPEVLWVCFGAPITLVTPGPKLPDLAIVFVFSAVFWAMGFRHRHMPIFEVIRGINDRQKRMEDKLDQALGASEEKPQAKVRHLRRV